MRSSWALLAGMWPAMIQCGVLHLPVCHRRIGMKCGFTMRQQVVAAIHAKVLRLNSAAVGHANIGRIINLARCVEDT